MRGNGWDPNNRSQPKPEINKLIQHRETEKNFLNENSIATTKYVTIRDENDLYENVHLLPGILKTTTLGYDGKGQYKLNSADDINNDLDFTKEYILEKLINLNPKIYLLKKIIGLKKSLTNQPRKYLSMKLLIGA